MDKLQYTIEQLFNQDIELSQREFEDLFAEFIELVDSGKVRAAERINDEWRINPWVKKGILLGFRYGKLIEYPINAYFSYIDKHTFPLKKVTKGENIRIVPGGSSVRSGSYLGPGVVIMPPAYVNAGAYVGRDSMVDSHALIGSCAQIGARVHLSAGAQIGGVLEPIGALPVIIEDDVIIGGNCGVYEGTIVKSGAVLGAGTILTASIPVYDTVYEKIIRSSKSKPLVIPQNAVVVPGSRPVNVSQFALENNLQIQCAIIIKYRDEKTGAATTLEDLLR